MALAAVVLLALGCGCASPVGTAGPVEPPAGWRLVWSDEFARDGLPDPATWDQEEGFVRNEDLQWYTRARSENARVEDGLLVIEARAERCTNPAYDASGANWRTRRAAAEVTSASLVTLGRASVRYGRVAVRAKLPQGRGTWPAIWLLGVDRAQVGWPRCGEIDLMEFVGKIPDRVHGTVHWRADDGLR